MESVQGESTNSHVRTVEYEEENAGPESNGNADVSVTKIIDEDININAEQEFNVNEENSSQQINGSHAIDDDDNNDIDENNCLVRLVFRDEMVFDELHQVIGKCVRDALFLLKKSANLIVDKSEHCVKVTEISAKNDDNIFIVDTLPTENTNTSEIPDYNSSTIDVLNDEEEADTNDADTDESKPKTGQCWNCGGDHNMKDCKEKRDLDAINRAKQSFIQKTKTERYHLDAEQKYSHLVPGKLSDNLRQALGLRSRELPMYIYKMRLYGYPEGWLEEAKINHSGLSLFHSENKSNDLEDEEAYKVEYDPSKFIEYPGFNALLPSNLIDDGPYYRVPPMTFEHSKEGLIKTLQDNLTKTYKRKRLKLDVNKTSATPNVKDDDMDIGSDAESPDSIPVQFPQPQPDADETNSNTVTDVEQEASLLELERRQEELRRALQDAEDNSSDSNSLSNQNGQRFNADECNKKSNEKENVAIQNDHNEEVCNKNSNEIIGTASELFAENVGIETNICVEQTELNVSGSMATQPSTPSVSGQSRESVFGTPLIKQVSPYTKLPSGDRWSIGVTDVIDFENLPDSTGTYEKLTGVIKKVRTVIKRMNDEPDDDSS